MANRRGGSEVAWWQWIAGSAEEPARSKGAIAGAMARLSFLAGVLVAALLIPATTFVAVTGNDLIENIMEMPLELVQQPNPQTSRLLASDGTLLAYFYDQNREDVPLAKISKHLQDALLSIEDNRFYEHGALDLKGTLRALVNNASGGQKQGGSSITQQLVKLTLVQQATTKEQQRAATKGSVSRKIRELKYAIAYEEKHSKQEILERYLNIAYFGASAYGIKAAANRYFSVDPAELDVVQSATLAGLVKNPVEFDPIVYPERALQRRNTVLAVMGRLGRITENQTQNYQARPLGLDITNYPNGCVDSIAAFACDYIKNYLLQDPDLGATAAERKALLETGGLSIRTSIDVRVQAALNKAAKEHVDPKDLAIGSLASIEPGTGKVRGVSQSRPMGRDKKKGESYINFAVPSKYGYSGGFQAGSTFKMFTVAAALEKGIPVGTTFNSPRSMVMPTGTYRDCKDRPTGQWNLVNSTTSGSKNMYTGTRESVNTYFSQLEKQVGLCDTVSAARAMGIPVPERDEVSSFTLGVTLVSPLEVAAAYAVPASGGTYCAPSPVDQILDREGKEVKRYRPNCTRVISKGDAAQINDILRGVQEPGGYGYSSGTGLSIPSAAKTGTTNENLSVWYAGYTPEMATAAMIAGANADGRPRAIDGTTIKGRLVGFDLAGGSTLAGPMWKEAMGKIQNWVAPQGFDPPPASQPSNRSTRKTVKDDKNDDKDEDRDDDGEESTR